MSENAVNGNILSVILESEHWDNPDELIQLNCGSFEIDAVDFSDPPPTVSIKAVAVPLTKTIRSQPKCKAWERITIKDIVKKITQDAKMAGFSYLSDINPMLDRADQRQVSDLAFLVDICKEQGLSLKVADDKIIVFNEVEFEAKEIVCTFKRWDDRIISVAFSQDTSQTAKSATVSYKDPMSGKLVSATFEPDEPPATERELIDNSRPSDLSGDEMRNILAAESSE